MSIELDVKLTKEDISLKKLVEETLKNVALLINCRNVPSLHIVEIESGTTCLVTMEEILQDRLKNLTFKRMV
ncbi:hypothetical protein [Paenibacillus tyrfis]|uniref:hypothetical protein n=1 Tax=Paenibacillus tyrfis TaxID=1501230 RepID=UPI0011800FA8|nr:hypothetical protein [Paenibacillus tyrfis]